MRSVVKASAAVLAAALFLAGCSGDPDDSASPSPLAEVGVSVKDSELPTLAGAYGEAPAIAYPLRPGQTSPPPPSEEPTEPEGEGEGEGTEPVAGEDDSPAASEETEPSPSEEDSSGSEDQTAEPSPSASQESPYIQPPTSLQAQVQAGMEGDGEAIKSDNLVSVDLVVWAWGETEPVASLNTFVSGLPLVMAVRADDSTLVGVSRTIVGHKIGSRVMGVIPPSVGSLAAALNLDEGTTLVAAIDIREQFPKDSQAQADAKPTNAQTGPKISGALGGPATVSVPGGIEAPADISTTVIATGSGPVLEDGQQILIHYSATDWSGKSDGDTWTADRGPLPVTLSANPYGDGSVLTAFSGLVGVPVGSRVLIVTPGKEGSYLAEAIVVDIVALVEGNPAAEEGEDSSDGQEGEDGDETAPADGTAGDPSTAPSTEASAEASTEPAGP